MGMMTECKSLLHWPSGLWECLPNLCQFMNHPLVGNIKLLYHEDGTSDTTRI